MTLGEFWSAHGQKVLIAAVVILTMIIIYQSQYFQGWYDSKSESFAAYTSGTGAPIQWGVGSYSALRVGSADAGAGGPVDRKITRSQRAVTHPSERWGLRKALIQQNAELAKLPEGNPAGDMARANRTYRAQIKHMMRGGMSHAEAKAAVDAALMAAGVSRKPRRERFDALPGYYNARRERAEVAPESDADLDLDDQVTMQSSPGSGVACGAAWDDEVMEEVQSLALLSGMGDSAEDNEVAFRGDA